MLIKHYLKDDADMNLRFDDNNIKAHPLTVDGFAYMWSGVRAMYGVKTGKVAFEVKVLVKLVYEVRRFYQILFKKQGCHFTGLSWNSEFQNHIFSLFGFVNTFQGLFFQKKKIKTCKVFGVVFINCKPSAIQHSHNVISLPAENTEFGLVNVENSKCPVDSNLIAPISRPVEHL